jgi:hypothetical protein
MTSGYRAFGALMTLRGVIQAARKKHPVFKRSMTRRFSRNPYASGDFKDT